jgi:hypothetical protein
MYHRHHRFPRAALWTAGGFFAAAGLWMLIGVPALVKYPTDLDVSPRYEGTFTLFVDPATSAPLDDPLVLPLTVDRQLQAISSGADEVVVEETIVQRAGDLVDTTQTNAYVMDRSSLENLADDRAYAFDPANVVDRSGAYRLNLPFDVDPDGTYEIYKNEIDGTYRMVPDEASPTSEAEGLELTNFVANVEEAPLSEAYFTELSSLVPLPTAMSLEELKPHLLAAGLDVDALLADLLPVLTPEDTAALMPVMGEPIGLDYVLTFSGQAGVESVTGAEVRVGATESIGVRPELASLPVLLDVLDNYPDVPAAAAAVDGLTAISEGPAITLFEYAYDQTPASVTEIADEVASMRQQVLLAQMWLPLALAGAGVLALAVGTVVALRRRPPAEPAGEAIDLTTLPEAPVEKELVGTGGGHR